MYKIRYHNQIKAEHIQNYIDALKIAENLRDTYKITLVIISEKTGTIMRIVK